MRLKKRRYAFNNIYTQITTISKEIRKSLLIIQIKYQTIPFLTSKSRWWEENSWVMREKEKKNLYSPVLNIY